MKSDSHFLPPIPMLLLMLIKWFPLSSIALFQSSSSIKFLSIQGHFLVYRGRTRHIVRLSPRSLSSQWINQYLFACCLSETLPEMRLCFRISVSVRYRGLFHSVLSAFTTMKKYFLSIIVISTGAEPSDMLRFRIRVADIWQVSRSISFVISCCAMRGMFHREDRKGAMNFFRFYLQMSGSQHLKFRKSTELLYVIFLVYYR